MTMRLIMIILLFLIPACADPKYPVSYTVPKPIHYDVVALDRYLIQEYGDEMYEHFIVVYIKDDTILDIHVAAIGSPREVNANLFMIHNKAVLNQSNKIIFAHNHPGKFFASPSSIDLASAKQAIDFFNLAKIEFLASVVLTEQDTFWIRQHKT